MIQTVHKFQRILQSNRIIKPFHDLKMWEMNVGG
jgi:hypothetical protein